MAPLLAFFGVAVVVGCVIRGIVGLRRRAVTRQVDASDGDLCRLEQATRISSISLVASLVGLVAVGLAYLVLRLS